MEFPETGLVRLIYVSLSCVPPNTHRETVRDIVIKSIANNRRVDVTGMLLSNAHLFVQVLEGPAASVRQVYTVVSADPRHSDVRLIDVAPAERRLFRDWNMNSQTLPDDVTDPQALTAETALALFNAPGAAVRTG